MLMKGNRRFWFIFVASLVAVVGGYVTLMSLNLDKTHEGQYLPAIICLIMIPTGGIILFGTLVYAVIRTAADRRS